MARSNWNKRWNAHLEGKYFIFAKIKLCPLKSLELRIDKRILFVRLPARWSSFDSETKNYSCLSCAVFYPISDLAVRHCKTYTVFGPHYCGKAWKSFSILVNLPNVIYSFVKSSETFWPLSAMGPLEGCVGAFKTYARSFRHHVKKQFLAAVENWIWKPREEYLQCSEKLIEWKRLVLSRKRWRTKWAELRGLSNESFIVQVYYAKIYLYHYLTKKCTKLSFSRLSGKK